MLFGNLLFPKENDANKKKVNGKCYCRVSFNIIPRFFHFAAPVYIIKNQDRMFIDFWQQLLKIPDGWFFAMVAINKNKIKTCGVFCDYQRQSVIEIALNNCNVF